VTQTLDRPPDGDAPSAVDPRIQARRDQVALERSRRRRHRGLIAAAVVGVVGLVWLVTHSPLLSVRRVEATGTLHVPAATVRRVAGLHTGQHLVGLDAGAARARLLALPWVAGAKVDVSWRGTVRLSVTERRAVAALAVGPGRWMVVDGQGRALGLAPTVPPGLVAMRAAVEPVSVGRSFGAPVRAGLAVVAALHDALRSRVTAVVVGHDGTVGLYLRPSGYAWLCAPTQLTQKLASLTTLFAHVDDQDVSVVDVCIPDSPRVTRTTPAASTASPTTSVP
jgi:cell division protein FtsQ